MRKLVSVCMGVLAVLFFMDGAGASPGNEPFLSSNVIPQGGIGLIGVPVEEGEAPPQVFWMDREVLLAPPAKGPLWYGFLGVDLKKAPGLYAVTIKRPSSGADENIDLLVTKKDYGVRRLTLPKKMVDLDSKTLKRVRKESREMKALWRASPSAPLWRGAFTRPVPGKVVGPFGRRSVINKQPRSPHSGVDMRGERGTPVKAVNRGRVTLLGDHFFTGLTVVVDHGGGIQSMYFHLDKIMVREDQIVQRGEIIGLVGSTGRSTGPHLHWGVRINGARVDPVELAVVSGELEK